MDAESPNGKWVEVWSGFNPDEVGRALDDEGISMRIAANAMCSRAPWLIRAFRGQRSDGPALARLLVPESDRDRAKEIVAAARAKP